MEILASHASAASEVAKIWTPQAVKSLGTTLVSIITAGFVLCYMFAWLKALAESRRK